MSSPQSSGRWVAVLTGTISILIGMLYLILITFLDSRGPMLPPPSEAFGEVVGLVEVHFEEAPQLFSGRFR